MSSKKKPRAKGPIKRSKLEDRINDEIQTNALRFGYTYEYEIGRLHYVLRKYYIPDFILTLPNGRKIYIEVKGYLRPTDRTKMVAVKKGNPDLDIRFLFDKDNKMSKNSKTTYSTWATKNGFPYAIGSIPKEWYQE